MKATQKSLPEDIDLYLQRLPNSDIYELSYLHKDEIQCISASTNTSIIATGSQDGVVKFWKKLYRGIEFAKQFRAHVTAVSQIAFSQIGSKAASISYSDCVVKIYDSLSLDMIDKLTLNDPILYLEIAQDIQDAEPYILACTQAGLVVVEMISNPMQKKIDVHASKALVVAYNQHKKACISSDEDGIIDYWRKDSGEMPDDVDFRFKVQTDLYALAQNKETPVSLTISPSGNLFCIYTASRVFRIYNYNTGKILTKFEEAYEDYIEIQNNPNSDLRLERIEFYRRIALEKDMDKNLERLNAVWDESEEIIIYAAYIGIKFRLVSTGEVIRIIAKSETPRFTQLFLYQGAPMLNTSGKAGLGGSSSQGFKEIDPIIFAIGYHRTRFYLFTKRNPADEGKEDTRDIMNETLTDDSKSLVMQQKPSIRLAKSAVIHTTMGDIAIKLFPKQCPRTVENFTGHCMNGYYSQQIFHRVIKGFMIQTGDPEGNGHGGTSIWGGEFEDEISEDLKHDRPFTVSMANRGPNTNGSQFFITTVAASWLNGRHTLFGRVSKGMDTVCRIEGVPCDKKNKPKADIRIVDITINLD